MSEWMTTLDYEKIRAALDRIRPFVHETPLLSSSLLNQKLGHEIFFKAECLQKTGAFKARGALNTLISLKEKGQLPVEVVTFSSGNHAQAIAWSCQLFKVKAKILMPESVSRAKLNATRSYGAEVILFKKRSEVEEAVYGYQERGAYLIPPYDHDDVICGQGTACLEALSQLTTLPDAVFAPCGGGGLISGSWLATRQSSSIQVFGAEPLIANDAARSRRDGRIFHWPDSPPTIADGARTLHISERTFQYIQKLDGIFEIPEEEILYWTQWLCSLLKVHLEPTAALGMAAALQWMKSQTTQKRVLVILSGGNVDREGMQKIWAVDRMSVFPSIN